MSRCANLFRSLLSRSSLRLMTLLAAICLLPMDRLPAFAELELSLGTLTGTGWRAEEVRFDLDWSDPAMSGYRLLIGSLELPGLEQPLRDLRIDCPQGRIDNSAIACKSAQLKLPHPRLDRALMAMSFELDLVTRNLSLKLSDIAIAGGRLALALDAESGGWRLRTEGRNLQVDALRRLWSPLTDLLPAWSLSGKIDLQARLEGRDMALTKASWNGSLSGLSLSDAEGRYIGEGLAADLEGRLNSQRSGWRIDHKLSLRGGELLTPYAYLDAAAHPFSLEGRLLLDEALERLALHDLRLYREGLLDLRLEGDFRLVDEVAIEGLKLRLAPFQAETLYAELLQPVLAGTPWDRFELAGELELSLDLQQERIDLELGLTEFSLDDLEQAGEPRRLGLYGVTGRLHWNRGGERRGSHLAWQAGHLLEHIDIGPGEIDFELDSERFSLSRTLRLPVLDGTLVVDRLDMEQPAESSRKLRFDGFIEPISMQSLSRALGWPPLSGKLSGMIPGVRYEQGLLSVEGVLLMRIFDGDILIRQLQTRDLLGIYPQLSADIELRGLDLESLTRTFSFGLITGRLDGHVRDLRLEEWAPVAFDARFYTPEKDDSRRRISQKAVDNISNLGGAGLSGSLARSFLGIFKEFGYKRIGIGCRLRGGVCEMVGAGPAKQGYYLVEGSGLPRIDIIGYNASADWSRLVEQLKQITESGDPLIE